MEIPTELSQPLIVVRRIKVLSFWMDETNIAEDAIFKVDFNQQFSYNIKDKLVFTVLRVWYSIPGRETNQEIVLDSRIQTIFEITNMQEFIKPNGSMLFPNEVLINVTSMSITHSRAAIAIQSAGSVFGDTLVPVVNPLEATMAFFNGEPQDLTANKESIDLAKKSNNLNGTIEDNLAKVRKKAKN